MTTFFVCLCVSVKYGILVNTCVAKLIFTPLEKARNPQGVTMRVSNLGPLVNVMFQTD
jgi:hypothetical protein